MLHPIGRRPAIVVVDDEPDIVLILHRLVRSLVQGYDIVAVTTGADVLAEIEMRPVPLVITDYNMPGMHGLQLAMAVKERAPATHIVLITAYGSTDLQRQVRANLIDHYLPKPFPLESLESIVLSTLNGVGCGPAA